MFDRFMLRSLAAALLCATAIPAVAMFGLPSGLAHTVDTAPINDALAVGGATAAEPVQTVANLLDRIATNRSLADAPEKRVQQQYDWYARNPDYLQRVFTRAGRYLPYIVEQIEQRGMPIDIALLPVVESAFDPFAYSHGRAAGLWQFIPGTGRMYGLRQDWWYDGRRDVVAATNAALDYLQALHRKVDGDWLLAIAAYNSGEGRVLKAMRRNRKAGLPTDFWHLKLPRETRAYVPKLLAINRIVANRAALSAQFPVVPPQNYFAIIELDGQLDLALAAEFADVTIEEIYRLNPGFNRWATSPAGPHRIVVPSASTGMFEQRLAALPADQRVRWQRYKIRPGDALSTIAKQHGTSTAALKQANSLGSNGIRAGDYLMIPRASRPLNNYELSASGREQSRLNRDGATRYTVRSGDSFWSIGKKFGVTSRQIARWNGMAPADTLSVGRELVIRSAKKTPEPALVAAGGPGDRQRRVAYVVRSGDSLATISSRFRVTISQLVDWNKLDREKYLQPGQRLVMFIDVTRQSGG